MPIINLLLILFSVFILLYQVVFCYMKAVTHTNKFKFGKFLWHLHYDYLVLLPVLFRIISIIIAYFNLYTTRYLLYSILTIFRIYLKYFSNELQECNTCFKISLITKKKKTNKIVSIKINHFIMNF